MEGSVRFVVPLLGALRLQMFSRRWRMLSPIHMGIMRSRYEGSFSATLSRRAAVAFCHCAVASALKIRNVYRKTR